MAAGAPNASRLPTDHTIGVDEIGEDLSSYDGDLVIKRIRSNASFDSRSPATGCIIRLLAKIVRGVGTELPQARAVRDDIIQQAGRGFDYDPDFNDWVRQRELDLYAALGIIGDLKCTDAMQ